MLLEEYFEQTKARMRAKVEHSFRVIKQQFGFNKVRYRGIAKNDIKLQTMFALANQWLVRAVYGRTGTSALADAPKGQKPPMRLETWLQNRA